MPNIATVVVVDDDQDLRESIGDLLRWEGYRVEMARNGREALQVLEHMPGEPCLVLLDMMMPEMNGQQVLMALRTHDRLVSMPVVVMSAHAHEAEARGASRFLRKPASADLLLKLVAEFCDDRVARMNAIATHAPSPGAR
jgi:CheY-like chemotaxis protein